MTGKTPKSDSVSPADKAGRRVDENAGAPDEPDLLSANIDALMGGSAAPVTDPINLDEYPYKPDDESDDLTETLYPSSDDEPARPPEEMYAPDAAADEPPAESFAAIDAPDAPIIELGFYGKLPAYGDFIQKRLPQDFINPWHEWVQTGMLACRAQNPEGWLSYYLNCPAWCFVLGGGICGEQAVAGITIPSVDRVGRYFNFTMASILPADTDPAIFAGAHHKWFKDLEILALSVLDQEMNQEDIDRSINERAAELSWSPPARLSFKIDENHASVSNHDAAGVVGLLPALLHQLIARDHDRYGLWWHRGSAQATAQLLSCARMPVDGTYLDLMMDKELRDAPQSTPQEPEVDYMDELLSG